MTIFAFAFYTKASDKVKSDTMIGLRDGWKIYVGIVPYCCGGRDHKGLHHIKEGLPVIPSRGDIFYPSPEAYDDMIAFHGEMPCEECPDKDGGCWCHNYDRCPIIYTEDCNYVKEVFYFQKEKEIIILLSCPMSFTPSEIGEIKADQRLNLMARLFGRH